MGDQFFSSFFGSKDPSSSSSSSPFRDGSDKVAGNDQSFKEKVNQMRSFAPKSVTSDVANIIGTMYNTKIFARRTVQGYMSLLVDRFHELNNYWVSIHEKRMEESKMRELSSGKTAQMTSDTDELEWKDFDQVEQEDLQQQVIALQNELAKYRDIVRIAERRCSEYDHVNQLKEQLEMQVSTLQSENHEMQMCVAQEFAKLKLDKKLLQNEIATITAERDELLRNGPPASSTDPDLSLLPDSQIQMRNEMEQALSLVQAQAKSASAEAERLQKLNVSMEEELHTTRCANADLLQRMAELSSEVAQLDKFEAQVASAMQAKAAAEKRAHTLEEAHNDLLEAKTQAEGLLERKDKKIKKLGAHKEVLVRECVALRAEVAGLKDVITALNLDMEHSKEKYAEQSAAVDRLIHSERELQHEVAHLTEQLAHERSLSLPLKESLNALNEEKAMILQSLEACKVKLAQKEDQLGMTVRQLVELQVSHASLSTSAHGGQSPVPPSLAAAAGTAAGTVNKLLSFSGRQLAGLKKGVTNRSQADLNEASATSQLGTISPTPILATPTSISPMRPLPMGRVIGTTAPSQAPNTLLPISVDAAPNGSAGKPDTTDFERYKRMIMESRTQSPPPTNSSRTSQSNPPSPSTTHQTDMLTEEDKASDPRKFSSTSDSTSSSNSSSDAEGEYDEDSHDEMAREMAALAVLRSSGSRTTRNADSHDRLAGFKISGLEDEPLCIPEYSIET